MGESQKITYYIRGNCLKRGRLGQFAESRSGVGVFRGELIPNAYCEYRKE